MVAVAGAMMWGLHVCPALDPRASIRAVAEDREMAAIMGRQCRPGLGTTFFLGSALGGAAGV